MALSLLVAAALLVVGQIRSSNDPASPGAEATVKAPTKAGESSKPYPPELVATTKRHDRLVKERQRRINAPAAKAERKASRKRYRNLSDRESQKVLVSKQPGFAKQPLWQPPTMQGTSKVLDYLSETTAVVDVPRSKHNAIVESIGGPIAVKDELGRHTGIDTTLKKLDSGEFSATETVVPTRFPSALADGIKLGAPNGPNGMVIRPGAGNSPPTLLEGDKKLFYANTAKDTDVIAEAVANGAAVSWSLRSPASPSLLALDMSFGVGVTLRKTEDHTVEVLFGETVIAVVEPVKAFDAQGTIVAAEYRIVDNRLGVAVFHRKQDFAYPIVVDPVTTFSGVPTYRDEYAGSTAVTNTPTIAPWAFHRPTAGMEYSATPDGSGYRLKLYNTPAVAGPGFYHAYLQYAPP
ncbi:MAG: hypothetical protein ACPHCI_09800, partial [Solirubrobacterales bacterium]